MESTCRSKPSSAWQEQERWQSQFLWLTCSQPQPAECRWPCWARATADGAETNRHAAIKRRDIISRKLPFLFDLINNWLGGRRSPARIVHRTAVSRKCRAFRKCGTGCLGCLVSQLKGNAALIMRFGVASNRVRVARDLGQPRHQRLSVGSFRPEQRSLVAQ